MSTFENYCAQLAYFSSAPSASFSPAASFLLGAAYVRTEIALPTLATFLQNLEIACKQLWITEEEMLRINFEVYMGRLGTAKELLAQFYEGRDMQDRDVALEKPYTCDLCGQSDLRQPGFSLEASCSHVFHSHCAEIAIKEVMLRGGSETLYCPSKGCKTAVEEVHLQRLFPEAERLTLFEVWKRPIKSVSVHCPTFACGATLQWRSGQFFSCGRCAVTYCLHCLATVDPTRPPHSCGPHMIESVEVGEAFAQGTRFTICPKCAYWCCASGANDAICRCGRVFCADCHMDEDRCRCRSGFLQKLYSLSQEVAKHL